MVKARQPIINKRVILQPILDKIEPGWLIVKPSELEPCDVETLCILQHMAGRRHTDAGIHNHLYAEGKLQAIEARLRTAISGAQRF